MLINCICCQLLATVTITLVPNNIITSVNPMASWLGPGMGLKFLRDGVDSANLVAMYSVDGQPNDWNFFSHDFSNHVAPATGMLTKMLAKRFAMA